MSKNKKFNEVLIVEDSHADFMLLAHHLKNFSDRSNITLAKTMQFAHEESKKNKFDLVILDLNLPDSHGPSSIDAVRKFDSVAPIIATTGYLTELVEEVSREKSISSIFSKEQIFLGEADIELRRYLS